MARTSTRVGTSSGSGYGIGSVFGIGIGSGIGSVFGIGIGNGIGDGIGDGIGVGRGIGSGKAVCYASRVPRGHASSVSLAVAAFVAAGCGGSISRAADSDGGAEASEAASTGDDSSAADTYEAVDAVPDGGTDAVVPDGSSAYEVRVIASGQPFPTQIAIVGNRLFWTCSGDGGSLRFSTSTGGPVTIAPKGVTRPSSLIPFGAGAVLAGFGPSAGAGELDFVSADGSLRNLASGLVNPRNVATSASGSVGFLVDSSADPTNTTARIANADVASSELTWQAWQLPYDAIFAADASTFYWASQTDTTLWMAASNGSTPPAALASGVTVTAIALDSAYVYVGESPDSVVRIGRSTGQSETLATGLGAIRTIAVDDSVVAFADRGVGPGDGAVHVYDKATGRSDAISKNDALPLSIALLGRDLYWVDGTSGLVLWGHYVGPS